MLTVAVGRRCGWDGGEWSRLDACCGSLFPGHVRTILPALFCPAPTHPHNWHTSTHKPSRYQDETSQWTLDYPPLFAWFEWALSQVAARVDPAMLVRAKRQEGREGKGRHVGHAGRMQACGEWDCTGAVPDCRPFKGQAIINYDCIGCRLCPTWSTPALPPCCSCFDLT